MTRISILFTTFAWQYVHPNTRVRSPCVIIPLALILNLVFFPVFHYLLLFSVEHSTTQYFSWKRRKKIKTVQLPLLTHLTLVRTHLFNSFNEALFCKIWFCNCFCLSYNHPLSSLSLKCLAPKESNKSEYT